MPTTSNFPFVNNDVLRTNLDEAFDHILTLLPFTEAKTYNATAKSAFRKTIIIYTASIVEALLFHVLDTCFTEDDIAEHYSSWQLKNKKDLHEVADGHKIVSGDYKKIPGDGRKEKLNLGQINSFLKEKGILSEDLFGEIGKIQRLRNEQHINTQTKVKVYTRRDLETAFSVAREVKEFAKNNCN